MNGLNIRLLQWSYPMLLWLMVALFTVLACKNVVGSNEWKPAQPGFILSENQTFQTQYQEAAPTVIAVAAR